MPSGQPTGTPQQRCGRGTSQALHRAFPPHQPDGAAEDVLGRLIEQIDQLPWPRSTPSQPGQ